MKENPLTQSIKRSCPTCNQDQPAPVFRPAASPGPVVRCEACGMVYVAPIEDGRALIFEGPVADDVQRRLLNSDNMQDIADCWELSMLPAKEAEWPALRENANEHLQRIETYLPKDQRKILDFGCGWGFFLAAAKERGWDTYGIEPLPGHAVHARAKFGLNVVTDTLHDDTFPAESFNAITAFQVFEHVPDPSGDIAKLCRMLAPGGVILVEVPNIETRTVGILKGKHRHFTLDHLNFFSAKTLSNLLQRQGLTVLSSYKPTRRMSYRHLVNYWGARVLPRPVTHAAQAMTQRLGLWERSLSVNLGDIVAVLAQKL